MHSENTSLPNSYLEIWYHPHSRLPPKIIDLTIASNCSRPAQDFAEDPYTPFPSLEDFEFIENQVLENHTAAAIDHMYQGLNGKYAKESKLQLKIYTEAKKCLNAAASIYHGVRDLRIS
jgi:hypothetical protein